MKIIKIENSTEEVAFCMDKKDLEFLFKAIGCTRGSLYRRNNENQNR